MKGSINLLPLEYRKKPIANREQVILIVLILAVLFYMVYYGVGVAGVEMTQYRQELSMAVAELEKMQDGLRKYEQKLAQNQVLSTNKRLAESLQKEIKPATPVIMEINKIIPAGVVLNAMETGDNGTLSLKGTAPGLAQVSDFIDRLNQSAHYKNARAANIQEADTGKALWNFEITCAWQKGGDGQ